MDIWTKVNMDIFSEEGAYLFFFNPFFLLLVWDLDAMAGSPDVIFHWEEKSK